MMNRMMFGLAMICGAIPGVAMADPVVIDNGSPLVATDGSLVQAHGAGITKVGDYYYMYGENRSDYLFRAVSMYRSKDLKTWEFRHDVLTASSAPILARSNIERPKIVYNPATRRFVLWAHKENGSDYGEGRVIVATSDSIDGDYTVRGEFRPLGYSSRDMTLYVDDDGAGYLISSTRSNYDLNIYRLTADFTGVDRLVTTLAGYHREAPALFRRDGVYFLVTSAATGWNPNHAAFQTAAAIGGPWTAPEPFGDANTYNSQSTYVLPIAGDRGTSWLYMGDQWAPAFRLKPNDSTYVWLPLRFPTKISLAMTGSSQITVNVAAGTVASGGDRSPVRMQSQSSGMCVNVAGDAPGYEAAIVQWDCGSARNMQLERRPVAGGGMQFVFQHSGLCLAEKAGGYAAVQTSCGAGARAQWTVSEKGIANRASGRCLNVSGNAHARGGAIITYPCSDAPNEQWVPR